MWHEMAWKWENALDLSVIANESVEPTGYREGIEKRCAKEQGT